MSRGRLLLGTWALFMVGQVALVAVCVTQRKLGIDEQKPPASCEAPLPHCVTQPKLGINQKGFAHITRGMTQEQVEAILGAPPGDYGTGRVVTESARTAWLDHYRLVPNRSWSSQDCRIDLTFVRGKVVYRSFATLLRAQPDVP